MKAVFKALNDETRRKILNLLNEKDLNAGDIAKKFDMSKPSISHHLDILKRADLISSTKKGQFIFYSINTSVIEELFNWIYNLKESFDEEKTNSRNAVLDSNIASDRISD